MSTAAAAITIRIRAMNLVMALSPCDRLPPAGAGSLESSDSELRRDHHVAMVSRYATCQPIGAVLYELRFASIGLRAAGAIGAFVHLAARAEVADLGILRRAERA